MANGVLRFSFEAWEMNDVKGDKNDQILNEIPKETMRNIHQEFRSRWKPEFNAFHDSLPLGPKQQ